MSMKTFFANLFSKTMLKQYLFGLIFIIIAISIIFLWLNLSTNHGDEYSVPNFSGLKVGQAAKEADDINLLIEVVDSVYNGPGKRGTIIDQNPPPDFKVKSHRKVFVTIKSVNPKIIEMPNFIYKTLIQAKSDIETYGLRIGQISYKPSTYDNVVLKQKYKGREILAGTKIPQGASIELVLGKSSTLGSAITPDLTGLTNEEAELEAAEFMLNIGAVLYDKTIKTYADSLNAVVLSQSPDYKKRIRPGGEIDIVLTIPVDTISE